MQTLIGLKKIMLYHITKCRRAMFYPLITFLTTPKIKNKKWDCVPINGPCYSKFDPCYWKPQQTPC